MEKTVPLRARCEELAHLGTGVGSCNAPLDEHGNCPLASRHMDIS